MRYFAPLIVLLLFLSTPAFAINAPANFRLTDCSSNTLTWAWNDVAGELGYEVHDDGSDTLVAETGAGVLSTQETGLTPNTTYIRHCHSYDLTTGVGDVTIGNETNSYRYPIDIWWNFGRCQMLFLQSEVGTAGNIYKIRFEQNNFNSAPINFSTIYMDETASITLASWVGGASGSGTLVFDGNLTSLAAPGWFEIVLDTPFNYSGTQNLLVSFRHQDGDYSNSYPTWNTTNVGTNRCLQGAEDFSNPPGVSATTYLPNVQFEKDIAVRGYSAPSNVVAACTLAVAPGMDNTSTTFTDQTNASITVQVALSANPGQTALELFYAKGDANGPTEAFTSGGMKSSGYSWDINALDHNTSYWFKARAQNYAGILTGNCAITTWSTSPSAPSGFACIGCTSDSITWAWTSQGGEGYDIYDNDTDTVVVADIAYDATYTIETGLSPNKSYRRYIKAYYDLTSGLENCATITSGFVSSANRWLAQRMYFYSDTYRGYCKFDLNNVSDAWTVIGARLYATCYNQAGAGALMDIRALINDPATAPIATVYSEAGSGTLFVDDSIEHRSLGSKVVTLNSDSYNWIESCKVSQNWCALGIDESTISAVVTEFRGIDWATVAERPWLEVEYEMKSVSAPSNVVEACTLAVVPGMDNTIATFTAHSNSSLTVQVALNGNPGGTALELFSAKGDTNGPTEAFTSEGFKTTGYSWDVTALDHNTSYWFKARAENHAGILTGNSAITTWSTRPGIPTAFACIGCTSNSLTWAWTSQGGEGYDIYDNDTDTVAIADIAYDATYTVETGLSPNTSYRRYIKAYYDLTSGFENCAVTTSGFASSSGLKYANDRIYFENVVTAYRGYARFGLDNVSDTWTVNGVKLYVTCFNQAGGAALMDIRALTSDPAGATAATIYSEAGSGTLFVDDSTEHRSTGPKVLTMNSDSYSWIENCVSLGWCAVALVEDTPSNDVTEFRPYNYATVEQRPWLEVEYELKTDSAPSNVVEICTAAAVPLMDNSESTFTATTEISITVQPGLNSNPNGTLMDLEYADGDANGPTGLFMSLGTKTSGYSWDVTGLDYGKSYWFKARAQNWVGIWSGYCDLTVWSTKAGPPDNFRFIDRTDTSITWAWDTRGGLRYNIYDNDTDTVTVGDIDGLATYTVETGLSPNVSYRRYMRAIRIGGANIYYYAESLSEVSTTSSTVWENVCTLNMSAPPAGDYLIIAAMQAKASTTLAAYGEFRLVRDETNEINYAMEETDNFFHSFMSSEVLTASGSDDYKYQLQIKSSTGSTYWTRAQNAAIIAILLPTSNYHSIDNLTEGSTTSASFVRHSGVTVSPPGAGDDYWVIHCSNFKESSTTARGYSRLYDGSNELAYGARDPYNANEWFTQGGFSVLKGISSDVTLEAQYYRSSGTCSEKNVHITAVRLSDGPWAGYADNALYTQQSTTSQTGVTAVTRTFTVTDPQNYLIMGSCSIGISGIFANYYPIAWFEHNCGSGTTTLGEMRFYEVDSTAERASFVSMRRMFLTTGSHTIRVMFRRSNTSYTVYARCPAVIAIPLEGEIEELTSPTNAIEVCTLAAVPVIDNTTATFVFSNANNIYAQVDANGNSPGTLIELEYAKGNTGGPTEGFTPAGIQTSGYAWDIAGLTLDSSYWFRVHAQNWAGLWSNYSGLAVTSTTAAGGASLNTPTGLSYLSCSSTTLTWSWTDTNTDPNESGSDFFNGDNDSIVISGITADGNTTVETGLLPNRTYNRYIRAYINLGEKKYSSLSSIVTGNTLGAVPGKPQFFTITTTSATISWSRNGNPSYTVFELARSDGGPWNTRTTTTGLNFGDIGLVADSTYWYRVRSVNLDGLPSDWSENDSLTTLPPGDPVVSVFSGPMLVYGPTASPPLSFTCDQDADFQVQLGGDGSPFSGAFLYSGSVTAGVPENQVFDRDVDLNPDNIPLEIYVTCSDPGNTSKFGFAQCAVYDDHLAPTSDVTYPSDGMFTATLDVISGNALDTGGANVGLVELVLLDETDGRYYDNASNAFDSLSPLPFAVTNPSESWSTNASLIVFTDAHVYKVASLATDTVGNVGPYSANTSFTIDAALPDLTINSPPDASTTVIGPTVNADVQFQVDEDCDYFLQIGGNGTIGSGIDVGSGVALADTPYDVSIPATSFADDAVEHLYITVRSQANLAVVFKYRDFHDDQTPPITSVSTTLSGVMDPPPPLISGSSSDDKAGVGTVELGIRDEYGLYFDPVSGWFKPGTTWILASGTNLWNYDTNDVRWKNDVDYTISIRVTDLVGNVESRVVGMFTAVAPVTGGGFADGGGGGGGCFLATACYESRVPSPGSLVVRNRTGIYYISQADFEKLQTLRTFRDGVLSRYSLGRTFIRWYYRASPPLAGSIRCRPAAKTLTRWFVVTPAYLLAREALGESYMLRTLAFIMLLSALVFYRRRKSALTHAPVCREPTRPDR